MDKYCLDQLKDCHKYVSENMEKVCKLCNLIESGQAKPKDLESFCLLVENIKFDLSIMDGIFKNE